MRVCGEERTTVCRVFSAVARWAMAGPPESRAQRALDEGGQFCSCARGAVRRDPSAVPAGVCSAATFNFVSSFPVVIGAGSHPFPFRTRKLSLLPPMVLRGKLRGRVGHCRDYLSAKPAV